MQEQDITSTEWLSVVGKALAHLCLHTVLPADATIADKAFMLENLGLSRKDVASMLDTTPASVAELLRLKRKKKGSKKNGGKKKSK